jgi:anti-sigma B factor antagonist
MSAPGDLPSSPSEDSFVVRGEIDMASVPALESALRTYIEVSTGDVVVDCAEMTFIDSSGLATFVRLARELQALDRRLVVRNLTEHSRRVFVLTGVDAVIDLDD